MLAPDHELAELLGELNRITGETSYLGTWDDDDVVSVAVREGRGGVRVPGLYLGYRRHVYARALGRALLAYRDEEFISAYLKQTPFEPLTEHTTTDPKLLNYRLADVRELGYAVECEEFTPGVCCAAAPIFNPAGRAVAAFSVSVPKARFDTEAPAIIRAVTETAATATGRLRRGGST
jgi:DNA-binding IclR family transcriptional regulator